MLGPDYGSPSYWDERYSGDEECYDWYTNYRQLESYLSPYIKDGEDFEILIAGCGNSNFASELYDAGYRNITNIDISTVVINQMSDLHANKEDMEFTVMDARKMEYVPDQCFDLVVDKALSDAIVCSENNLTDLENMLKEVVRVLKTGGIYFVVSHAPPSRRLNMLQRHLNNAMEIEVFNIPKPQIQGVVEDEELQYHYLYVCRKIQA